MKLLRKILTFAVVATMLFVSGCSKDNEPKTAKEQNKIVTYYTIDGIWQLAQWNGAALVEGTHLYITLDRKEHRFEMWDNLNSMYTVMTSGNFELSVDDMDRDIIFGWYDYGVGDWNDKYAVVLNAEGNRMVWSAVSSNEEMIYVKVDELPEF